MAAVDDAGAKLIIVDTDVGVDDACALLLLLGHSKHPHRPVHLLAITTVSGNVRVDQVCRNVHRVLRVADREDIPIYRGMDKSYANVAEQALLEQSYHGKDGLGDVPDPDDSGGVQLQNEHAALAIIRLVNQHPGRISLVCLGPLTNIALALSIEPDLGQHLRDCYIMGGNYTARGNITPSAEFNFFSDPEAADVVLRQLRCPISLVTWELCVNSALSWDWLGEYTSIDTARGRFVAQIVASTVKRNYSDGQSPIAADLRQYVTCDEIAAAIAIDERIVTQSAQVTLGGVDQNGRTTRGQLVLDWRNKSSKENATTLKLVTGLDIDLYKKMLIEALSASTD